jgi:hypothetical protein
MAGVAYRDVTWKMARVTGLEPATSGVTGRHSNQLSYTRAMYARKRRRAIPCVGVGGLISSPAQVKRLASAIGDKL